MTLEDVLIFWEGAVTVISLSTTLQDEGLTPYRFVACSPPRHDDWISLKGQEPKSRVKVSCFQGFFVSMCVISAGFVRATPPLSLAQKDIFCTESPPSVLDIYQYCESVLRVLFKVLVLEISGGGGVQNL